MCTTVFGSGPVVAGPCAGYMCTHATPRWCIVTQYFSVDSGPRCTKTTTVRINRVGHRNFETNFEPVRLALMGLSECDIAVLFFDVSVHNLVTWLRTA